MKSSFTKVKLDLLIDIVMLAMVEEGIRGGICRSIHIHANDNNKYMKLYDKNKELSDDKNKELLDEQCRKSFQ